MQDSPAHKGWSTALRASNRVPAALAAILFIVIVALLTEGIYVQYRDLVMHESEQQLELQARTAANVVDTFIAEHVTGIRAVLGNGRMVEELLTDGALDTGSLTHSLLHGFQDTRQDSVAGLALYGTSGYLRHLHDDEVPGWAELTLPRGGGGLDDRLLSVGGRRYLLLQVPLSHAGEPLAVARLLLRFDQLVEHHLAPLAAAAGSTPWLLSPEGILLWHPHGPAVGQPLQAGFDQWTNDPLARNGLQQLAERVRGGRPGALSYQFVDWQDGAHRITEKLAGHAPLGSWPGAHVGFSLAYDQVAGPVRRAMMYLTLLTVLVAVAIFGGGWMYLRDRHDAYQANQRLLARLQEVMAVSPAVISHLKVRGRQLVPTFVSANLGRLLGYAPDDYLEQPNWWQEHLHPEDRPRAQQAQQALFERGRLEHSYRVRSAEGGYRWVQDSLVLLRDEQGNPVEAVSAWTDVTELKEAGEELRLGAAVFENAAEAAFITDGRWRVLRINPAFARLTGHQPGQLLGRCLHELVAKGRSGETLRELRQAMASEGAWRGELWGRRGDGSEFPAWLTLSCVSGAGGETQHFVGVFSDLSGQKEMEGLIHRLSNYDPLTGLPNRLLLQDHLRQALLQAHRTGSRLAVLFLDLDGFKRINEALGRETGDRVLRIAAERLEYGGDGYSTLGQAGGDQFLLVLEHVHDPQQPAAVAAELARRLAEPLGLPEYQLGLEASVGISVYPEDGRDAEGLLRKAETAMYHAKASHAGGYHFYTEALHQRAERRSRMAQALGPALQEGQLELYYQPQQSLAGGEVVGVEALLRWRHPEFGQVSPAEFIPLAEENGLIVEIGAWVLRQAAAQAVRWCRRQPLRVGVNLSLRQFVSGGLPETVRRVLAETGLEPGLLDLEITESLAMADPDGTVASLQALRALGVRLSLDDFGTGYSSLAYLQRLPLDTLKIDRSFVARVDQDPEARVLVRGIVSMAHGLGLRVIAEGVEQEAQRQYLRRAGCDEIQGYHLGRPMPLDEFEYWLEQRRLRAAGAPA